MTADRINQIFILTLRTFPDDSVLFLICLYLACELYGVCGGFFCFLVCFVF